MFHYSPGFLQRLSTSTVSVDVIKLKLESVRHLLSMEEEEELVEEQDEESDEEDLDSEVSHIMFLNLLSYCAQFDIGQNIIETRTTASDLNLNFDRIQFRYAWNVRLI